MFGWFKKKKDEEPSFDPINLTLKSLGQGYLVDYNFKTYVVEKIYTYDWGEDFYTHEFKLVAGDDIMYLHIEEDDETEYTITRPVNILQIDEKLPHQIKMFEKPFDKLTWNNRSYKMQSESAGYLNEKGRDNWEAFICWDYMATDSDEILSVEQWGEDDFEAHHGKIVSEYEFINILPSGAQ